MRLRDLQARYTFSAAKVPAAFEDKIRIPVGVMLNPLYLIIELFHMSAPLNQMIMIQALNVFIAQNFLTVTNFCNI